ncbi:MAG TPA: hypothetical protein DCL77_08125 [Prolixibacteraceae bacterium]|jgi:small basic protein|nr:hypothetical protein [Prolixibacteraceae bacterium]
MKNNELDVFDNILDESLVREPVFHLPADFAQKVTLNIVRHEQWKSDLMEYASLTAFLMALLLVVGGLYYYLDKEFVMQVFSFITGNVMQVVFAVFTLNFILFADKVLLRLLFSRWSRF